VSFTAYKTTDKGLLLEVYLKDNIDEYQTRRNSLDALNGAQFSIPVNSLFTNDTRDPKILKFFFEY
jgi:hypothetical protein